MRKKIHRKIINYFLTTQDRSLGGLKNNNIAKLAGNGISFMLLETILFHHTLHFLFLPTAQG